MDKLNMIKTVLINKLQVEMESLNINQNLNNIKIKIQEFISDDLYNYVLLFSILTIFYFLIYLFSLVIFKIIVFLICNQCLKKGDIVQITTDPWKGYVGKVTKVGIFTNNIKINKNLNYNKRKFPKKIINKYFNEIKQT